MDVVPASSAATASLASSVNRSDNTPPSRRNPMSKPNLESITDLPVIIENMLIQASELSAEGDDEAADDLLDQINELRNPEV